MVEFLAEFDQGRDEQVCLVARMLVNILPDDTIKRRLLGGFLVGRDMLPERSW